MRAFRKRNADRPTEWRVEVDYGDGWIDYGPPLHKRAAEVFAADLTRCGHPARIAPADPGTLDGPEAVPADDVTGAVSAA